MRDSDGIVRDFSSVFDGLVAAFHEAPTPVGKLYAGASSTLPEFTSTGNLPSLAFDFGSFTSSDWADYEFRVIWALPAKLRVSGAANAGAVSNMRAVLSALMLHGRLVRGLPVDAETLASVKDDGSIEFQRRIEDGRTALLIERKGPTLTTGRITETSDTVCEGDLTFGVEFIMRLDPRVMYRAQVAVLGLVQGAVENGKAPLPTFDDITAMGGYAEPTTIVYGGGGAEEPAFPSTPVLGPSASDLPRDLTITPGGILLAGGTRQLSVIVTALDFTTSYASSADWSSEDEDVATVNSAGLLTGVAEGSTTIYAAVGELQASLVVNVAVESFFGFDGTVVYNHDAGWTFEAIPTHKPEWRGFAVIDRDRMMAVSTAPSYSASPQYSRRDADGVWTDSDFTEAAYPGGQTFSTRDMHGSGDSVVALGSTVIDGMASTYIVFTTDAGVSWDYDESINDIIGEVGGTRPSGVSLFSPSIDNIWVGLDSGWVPDEGFNPGGAGLTLVHYDGESWGIKQATTDLNYTAGATVPTAMQIYADGSDVFVGAENTLGAIESPPAIFHSSDGGDTWTAETLPGLYRVGYIVGLSGTSASDVWALWSVATSGLVTPRSALFQRNSDGTWTDRGLPWDASTYTYWPSVFVTATGVHVVPISGTAVWRYDRASSTWASTTLSDHIAFLRGL